MGIWKTTCQKKKKKKRVTFSDPVSFKLAEPVVYEDEDEGNVEAIVHGTFKTRSISFWEGAGFFCIPSVQSISIATSLNVWILLCVLQLQRKRAQKIKPRLSLILWTDAIKLRIKRYLLDPRL
jgi:hypothetical protein